MTKVLIIESSPRGVDSASNQLAARLKQVFQARPHVQTVSRNVSQEPIPVLDGAVLGAFFTPEADQTPEQRDVAGLSAKLIGELREADTVVIAASMYNFSVPSQLKHYFDFVLRAGQTFQYTANGPQGLLTGKRAVILAATGGVYSAGPAAAADFVVPYLKQLLAFVGITEVTVIRAEGLALGPDAAKAGMAAAFSQIDQLT